ncbi:hypothetical protein V8D89_013445 [Ganoderma adspersum]
MIQGCWSWSRIVRFPLVSLSGWGQISSCNNTLYYEGEDTRIHPSCLPPSPSTALGLRLLIPTRMLRSTHICHGYLISRNPSRHVPRAPRADPRGRSRTFISKSQVHAVQTERREEGGLVYAGGA